MEGSLALISHIIPGLIIENIALTNMTINLNIIVTDPSNLF